MNRYVRQILSVPKWITVTLVCSFIIFIMSALLGGHFTNNYVPASQKKYYRDYIDVENQAGSLAYIDVTSVSSPFYLSDGNTYYIVNDEGVYKDFYWYLVIMSYDTADMLSDQTIHYNDPSVQSEPYRLYGKVQKPSSDLINELCNAMNITEPDEYYAKFGTSVLNVKVSRSDTMDNICTAFLGMSFLAAVFSLIALILYPFSTIPSRRHLKRANVTTLADEELAIEGRSSNLFFTDHFLINRKLKTIAYCPDILLVTPSNRKGRQLLIGYTRDKAQLALAQPSESASFDYIIEKLQEFNPELLIGNSRENMARYKELCN